MTQSGRPVIVTGDDFGLNDQVNQSIIAAHQAGLLGTASLMMTGERPYEAVQLARKNPSLKVGLHLAVTRSSTVLPPQYLKSIVDRRGQLTRNLTLAGFNYFFNREARVQLKDELTAQFQAFQMTGLKLDHVNVHNHMHMHPTVLGMILEIGPKFGMKSLRIPNEPYGVARKTFGDKGWRLGVSSAFLAPWVMAMKARATKAKMLVNDYLFGMSHTGAIDAETLQRILENLPGEGLVEIHLHPGADEATKAEDVELQALTDAKVRKVFNDLNLRLSSFSELVSRAKT